ncbi:MAG: lipoyl protein ligase domain-containing protein, partial [Steroidobacteraceae bacterium]
NSGSALAEQEMIRQLLDGGVQAPSAAMWTYSSVALILGRSQKPGAAMQQRADAEGIDVVVRAAGGGAVIAGPWMCSHTVLVPADHSLARMSLPRSYEAIGEAWRRALGRLGIATAIAPRAVAGPTGSADANRWACFTSLSCGELVGPGNRKIVGLAQVRRRNGVAICAGLLLRQPDWPRLVRVWRGHGDDALAQSLREHAVSCEECVPLRRVPGIAEIDAEISTELRVLGLAA